MQLHGNALFYHGDVYVICLNFFEIQKKIKGGGINLEISILYIIMEFFITHYLKQKQNKNKATSKSNV